MKDRDQVRRQAETAVQSHPKSAGLGRRYRRDQVRWMLARAGMNGRPLGRAPGKTGQPRHFVEWRRVAAEMRAVEQAKAAAS